MTKIKVINDSYVSKLKEFLKLAHNYHIPFTMSTYTIFVKLAKVGSEVSHIDY